jgi:SAM-dependent methyltransferase
MVPFPAADPVTKAQRSDIWGARPLTPEGRVRAALSGIQRDDCDQVIDQFRSLLSASQYAKLYVLTDKYVKPGSHVLDWGCGRGHFTYYLLKQGYRVTAFSFEHRPEIFENLPSRELDRLTFVQGQLPDPITLPFADGQFNAAFSVGVLEHARELGGDEVGSLLELRRILASDGPFICYHLPNRFSYIEALSRCLRSRGAKETFHRFRFTTTDIHRLCEASGLELLEIGRYGFLPRNSMNALPRWLRDSVSLARAVNRGDAVLESVFSLFVQNHFFVARPDRARLPLR